VAAVYIDYLFQLNILDAEFYESDLCQLISDYLQDHIYTKEIKSKPIPYNYRDFDRMNRMQILGITHEIEIIFTSPDREYNDLVEFEFVLNDTETAGHSPLKYTISKIDGMIKARSFGFVDQRRIWLLIMISKRLHKLSYDSITKLEIMFEDQINYSLDLVSEFDNLSQNELVNLLIRGWKRNIASNKNGKWGYTEYILDKLNIESLSKIVMIDPHQRLVKMARDRL